MRSKGLEQAAREPRRAVGQGLGYAAAKRGGGRLNAEYLVILEGLGLNVDAQTPKAKAGFTILFQNLMEAISASGQCLFTSYAIFPTYLLNHPNSIVTKILNAVIPHMGWAIRLINKYPEAVRLHLPMFHHTRVFSYAVGMKMNLGKYIRIGERGYNLERYINCKFGISAANDKLPKWLTDVPQDPNNPKAKVPLEKMKEIYYHARGWDSCGIPADSTLRRLKLL